MSYIHTSRNAVSAQVVVSSNNISRLVPSDAVLFREAFQQEPTYYCNNWLYILRSTRGDYGDYGYKFIDKDVLIGIGYRHHTVYLVHPMGKNRCAATLSLCQQIQQSLGCSIVLKKLDQELHEYLASSELFLRQESAPLLPVETFPEYQDNAMSLEEEAFPEHTLHLDTLYNRDTGSFMQSGSFMRKVKRFEKNTLTLTSRNDLRHIETMPGFSTLFASHPEKYHSYLQMIREVNTHNAEDTTYKVRAYYDERATIHGIYIAASLGPGKMGLYCAISSRDFPGITEWMDHDFFRRLYQDQIEDLYLGGSETSGVDTYIKKLFPITPLYRLQPMQLESRDDLSADLYVSCAD